jgi:shikimate dehydrogenase
MSDATGLLPISAHTQLVGLIGWPVGHSVSPRMHNAAFEALGLDWRYLAFPVSPEPISRVAEAVSGVRALGLRGANVTVPHKQAVMPFLDTLTPVAEAIGAVNTILVQQDGSLLGDNTDARGLAADLAENGMDPDGASVLILGAGGSARAAAFGLADSGAANITVLNRTRPRADELAHAMAEHFSECRWQAGSLFDLPQHRKADIVVNCTTLGMAPAVEAMPWQPEVLLEANQGVYDLVYNPTPTRLVQFAQAQGAHAANGSGMLVWQGAFAFELWTGRRAPVHVMQRAIGLEPSD